MKIFNDYRIAGEALSAPSVAIGIFDGVHLGHRKLIEEACDSARTRGGECTVLTMHPHPQSLFHKEAFPGLITDRETKISLIEKLGVDVYVELEFTPQLASMSGEEFVSRILWKGLGARYLFVGFNFRFGRRRLCDADDLARFAGNVGMNVTVVPRVEFEGKSISSTRIREALQAGEVEAVAGMLGRPYSYRGKVIAGDGVGSRIGFPTANMECPSGELLIPRTGVYIVTALIGDRKVPGVVNIGWRPTRYQGTGQKIIEFHALETVGFLYGKILHIEFYKRIRDEIRFPAIEMLKDRIKKDVEEALLFFCERKEEIRPSQNEPYGRIL